MLVLACEETLILCGFQGFIREYVLVFLVKIIYIKTIFLRGMIKFKAAKTVRRDCIA